ncbi:extensin [Alphaproteobacteria bacterium GH1-50]|uniref:Extensin n=1 Tax=Kangsaoukella pontilimi TaxID=2691042 RepID=A0A7C9NEJ4_9RHOB|nr:extensin [Kangsaoukella pontilimi]
MVLVRVRWLSSVLTAGVVLGAAAAIAIAHPETPLPDAWNPAKPLVISDPVTPLTGWKLRGALSGGPACLAALSEEPVQSLPPLVDTDTPACGIRDRVRLTGVGDARLAPVETDCAIALRLAMWERHGLQPDALRLLGTEISEILHFQSYSCRPIRTMAGPGGRMSTHATGEAIDIAGFSLADGRRLTLISDWEGDGPEAAFLRATRDSACRWFATTLGPDYNALHADHFHLQARGWGLCR